MSLGPGQEDSSECLSAHSWMQVVTQLPLSSEECCPFTVLGSLAWVLPQLYIPLWLLTSQMKREKSVAGLHPPHPPTSSLRQRGKEGDGADEFALFPTQEPRQRSVPTRWPL